MYASVVDSRRLRSNVSVSWKFKEKHSRSGLIFSIEKSLINMRTVPAPCCVIPYFNNSKYVTGNEASEGSKSNVFAKILYISVNQALQMDLQIPVSPHPVHMNVVKQIC